MSNNMRQMVIVALSGLAVLALCLCIGVLGFVVGRNSMADNEPAAELSTLVSEQVEPPAVETTASTVENSTPAGEPTGSQPDEAAPAPEPTATIAEPATEPATAEPDMAEPVVSEPPVQLPPAQQEPLDLTAEELELMLQVWRIVEQEFDGNLPSAEEITYAAIQSSLELLGDEFTRFITPEVANQVRQQLEGSFEGIGAFVELTEEGYLIILRPIEGQPAELAGVQSNDIVTHIDGESVLGKSLDEIITEVKGPQGTEVTLTIVRESEPEPFDVTIVRDLIEIPIVEARMLDNNIAYVHLTSFSSNADRQLSLALEELLAQNPQALIFDLRDNPGGFLNQSVAVADLFLPEGIVLYQRDRNGAEEIFRSQSGDIAETIPLVVLVNPGSASASEIVAGAIKDLGRGVLIGETTFGKGSVQQTHTLPDGSELRVTIARWYTPNNQTIDGQGIAPDAEVPFEGEFATESDSQLQRAIEYILSEEL